MDREAIEEAIEVLEDASAEMLTETGDENYYGEAIAALRQALEQPAQQEPVAWRTFDGEGGYDFRSYEFNETYDKEWAERNPNHKGWVEPLYTAPPKRAWVGLTALEIYECWKTGDVVEAVEAKLKEKNKW
jgi:hypothetical protein